jgi:hypothetical protein
MPSVSVPLRTPSAGSAGALYPLPDRIGVIVVIVSIVFGVIPHIGWLLNLIIAPFIAVFYSRYLSSCMIQERRGCCGT